MKRILTALGISVPALAVAVTAARGSGASQDPSCPPNGRRGFAMPVHRDDTVKHCEGIPSGQVDG
jgi:hypothetical protein